MRRSLATLLTLIAATATAGPVRILVAVGNNVGLPGEATLVHAASDARRVADVFTALGDVAKGDLLLRMDAPASELIAALGRAKRLAAGHPILDVQLIVYFSGHGDETALHVAGERIPVAQLTALVDAVPAAMRLVVLDACRGEPGGRTKGLVDDAPFDVSVHAPAGPAGTLILRSSSSGEASQESDELGGAVFTHYFVSGLRGAGDVNSDREVTFGEAYDYAFAHTLRRSAATSAGVQHPSAVVAVGGAGPLVLTHTARSASTLVLPAGRDVRYLVYSQPSGTVLTETYGREDQKSALALPAGRFLVQRRSGGRYGEVEVALPYGGERALTTDDFHDVPYDVVARKGGAASSLRHELVLDYGFATGGRAELGQRLVAQYGLVMGAVALTAGVDLAQTDRDTDTQAIRERSVGGTLRVEWRAPLSPAVDLVLGGGCVLRWMAQRVHLLPSASPFFSGFRLDADYGALTGGPTAVFGTRVAVAGRLFVDIAVDADGLLLREDGALVVRFAGTLTAGLAYEF